MSPARIVRFVFGVVAGVMLVVALADILLTGHLSLISPFSFGALLAVSLAFMIYDLLDGRERSGAIHTPPAPRTSQSCKAFVTAAGAGRLLLVNI